MHGERSGERRVVRFVFPGDADPASGQISVLDLLGVQLLGKSPADAFDCELADGAHHLRIEQVIYQPEHSLRTNLVVRG